GQGVNTFLESTRQVLMPRGPRATNPLVEKALESPDFAARVDIVSAMGKDLDLNRYFSLI
ncbi:MAG: hypothetical protein AAFU85_31595, partial [Planctomycetota bacterium]